MHSATDPGERPRRIGDEPNRTRVRMLNVVHDRSPDQRLRQGLVLLAGAIIFLIVVGTGPSTFYDTPLGIGLVYLVSAAVGGKQGAYWATAVVLVGWGAAVVYVRHAQPDLDLAGLYLAGAGLGATVGILLSRAGFAVDPLGATATVAISGFILAFAPRWPGVLGEARTYALIVGAIGLGNAVAGAVARR